MDSCFGNSKCYPHAVSLWELDKLFRKANIIMMCFGKTQTINILPVRTVSLFFVGNIPLDKQTVHACVTPRLK